MSDPWGSLPALSEEAGSGAAPLPPAPPAEDRYVFARPVGIGGMGRVEAFEDRFLGRAIARKTLKPGLSPNAAGRLLREAHLTARLDHPGIVPVYDAGVGADGLPWYTMRLIRGQSLADARSGRPAVDLIRRVHAACEAVAYAHAHDVVHRDLTPWNVMVGPFGETLVVDWGLARDLQAREPDPVVSSVEPTWPSASGPALTQVGAVLGTPQWMSPEAARGEPVGKAADVYAIGRILAWLLEPRPGEPASPVPGDLQAIVDKATRADPDARYPDAGALAADLDAWLSGRRVAAHAYGVSELGWRFVQRWRAPLAVAGVATVALAVALVRGWQTTAAERDRAVAAESATALLLAASNAELSLRALAEGDTAAARRHADASLAAATTPNGRGAAALAHAAPGPMRRERRLFADCPSPVPAADGVLCRGAGLRWYDAPNQPRWARPDVDGDAVQLTAGGPIVIPASAGLRLLDPATGADIGHRGRALPGHPPIAGPAGVFAVFVTQKQLVLLGDGATEGTWHTCPPGEDALTFAHDGARWWAPCSGGTLLIGEGVDVRQRVAMTEDGRPFVRASAAAVGPRGLLIGTLDGDLATLDPVTGRARTLARLGDQPIRRLAVDGDHVAASPSTGPVRLYDLRTNAPAGTLPVGHVQRIGPAWVAATNGGIETWDIPFEPVIFPHHAGLADAAVRADGAVALADGSGGLTMIPADGPRWSDQWTHATLKSVVFGTDGRLWAGGADPGSARVIGPDGASPLPYPHALRRIAPLADGTALIASWRSQVDLLRPESGSEPSFPGEPSELQVSRDGRRVLLGGDKPWLRTWTLGDADPRVLVDGDAGGRAALSPDGAWVAAARRDRIEVHPFGGGPPVSWPIEAPVSAIAVDEAGAVWTGEEDGTVRRYLPNGDLDLVARAHAGRVADIELHAGRALTASWDRTARWWRPPP